MINANRAKKARQKSLSNYIDKLMQTHSRLDAIRIDFGYKKESRDSLTIDKLDKDIKRLYSNQRNNSIFKGIEGYAIKLEQGKDNHLHAHALFFTDGRQYKEYSIPEVANKIGTYWNENITNGDGYFNNCNMENYKNNGLGRINYNDKGKIKNLKENVLPYLCKGEQNIQAPDGKNIRVLRRGAMPKQNNKGRPRKSANPKSDKIKLYIV